MAGRDQAMMFLQGYRRRLAAAAVASLLLHLMLARILTVTSLGLDGRREDAAAVPPAGPAPRVDFTIRVPNAPAARPAHERPLAIAHTPPVPGRSPASRPTAAATPVTGAEPTENAAARAAAAPAPTRDLALAATPTPVRAAAAAATSDSPVEPAAAAVGADASPAPAPLARDRATGAAVASRWRPREVALLERLTAPTTARPGSAATDGAEEIPDAARAGRAAVDVATTDTGAELLVGPVGAADGTVVAEPMEIPTAHQVGRAVVGPRATAVPADRLAPRATGAAVAAADVAAARSRREAAAAPTMAGRTAGRRPSSTADAAARAPTLDGATTGLEATSDAVPAPVAGSVRRGGRAGLGGAVLAGPGRDDEAGKGGAPGPLGDAPSGSITRGSAVIGQRGDEGAGEPPGGVAPSRSPGRIPLVDAGGGSGVAGVADAAGVGVPGDPATDSGDRPVPGPQAVGLAAGLAAGRPRLAAAVPSRGGGAPETGEAELSVAPAPSGSAVDGRRHDGDELAGARPPDRVTVVALPTETRVRDVAEAFARRGRDARDRRTDPRTARADVLVDRGLEFLKRAQQADGRWCLGRFAGSGATDAPQITSDTAATGLALLAFLGAGHDHFDGPHRDSVRRGLEFLLSAQKPDGDLYEPSEDDLSNRCSWLYSHGIASIALCEAVGMTGDPLLRPAAARACGFIATSQHPDLGGWRYEPRADADLSVSGWMLVALRSGALAGVETDPRTLDGVRRLLDSAARPGASVHYAYDPRNVRQRADEMSGLCMTAVGALMRLHTGAGPDDPRVAAAARILAARRPAWDARNRDSYLWYCASQVLVHTGGPGWDAWYTALVDTLAAAQETAGDRAGSWNPVGSPPDRWGRVGGRIYVTALHLLALEVPARRLPTYTADR